MNFHGRKNCYRWFPMISRHGSKRLLSMGFEILGLDILSNQRLTRDDKHVPVDSP